MAKLAMNRTGYSLLEMLDTKAPVPSRRAASPIALYRASRYSGLMAFRARLPSRLPAMMHEVFTIVPNIFPKSVQN